MQREAQVIEVREDRVLVKLKPHKQCSKCGVCTTFGSSEQTIYVSRVEGINRGDSVLVSIPEKTLAKATMICYMFPLLIMLAGYYIGCAFSSIAGGHHGELPGIVGSIFGLGLGFIALRKFNQRTTQSSEYIPKIVRKIN